MKLTDLWTYIHIHHAHDSILKKMVDELLIEYVDGNAENARIKYETARNFESVYKMQGAREKQMTYGNAADAFSHIHKLLKNKKQ